MSAELLRKAASEMRRKAEAATPGPWEAVEGASGGWWVELRNLGDVAIDLHGENARHIAGMHPAVALAVADLLITAAVWIDRHPDSVVQVRRGAQVTAPVWVLEALTVARAYLGEAS